MLTPRVWEEPSHQKAPDHAVGANPKEVCVRAGHTSVAFTLDRYGHLFEGHDAELRDRLDAMHAAGLERPGGGAVVELPAAPSRPPARPTAMAQAVFALIMAVWYRGKRQHGVEWTT